MTMNELKALADSPRFLPVYVFYGAESFLVSFYSRRLCDNINNTYGMADFNFAVFEGDSVDLTQLCELIEAAPMFAEGKCILVKDYNIAALSNDDMDMLSVCIDNMPDTTSLVFSYPSTAVDARGEKWGRFFESVGKRGKAAMCETPNKEELCVWLRRLVMRYDATIEKDAAEYLIERIGTNMRKLRTEVPKIAAYACGEILKEHVDAIAVKQLDAKVYDMVGSLSSRRFALAYEQLDELFEQGEEPQKILGAVAGAFADIYIARTAKRYKIPTADIASDFGYKKNTMFRITNAMRSESRYSEKYLYRCIELIDEADRKLKSFTMDDKLVFEELFASIAALNANG